MVVVVPEVFHSVGGSVFGAVVGKAPRHSDNVDEETETALSNLPVTGAAGLTGGGSFRTFSETFTGRTGATVRTTQIGTLLVGLALFAGACGGGADDTSSVTVPATEPTTAPTSTTTSEPTTTTEDPKAAVEQAFYDQWDAFVEIVARPDPTRPADRRVLHRRGAGTLLDGMSQLIARRRGDPTSGGSERSSGRELSNRIQSIADDGAVVFECTVDGLVVSTSSTRASRRRRRSTTRQQRNEFELVDGMWKVANLTRSS